RPATSLLAVDLEKETWSTGADLPEPVVFACAEAVEGKLYVFAGLHGDRSSCGHAWVYDPRSDEWSELPSVPTPRSRASSAVIGGRIAVIGGIAGGDDDPGNSAKLELFDPEKGVWSQEDPLPEPVHGHASESLGGKIYVIGGYRGSQMRQTGDVLSWSPEAGWAGSSPLPGPRGFAASVVSEGSVYIFGNRGPIDRVLKFQASQGRWTATGAKDIQRHRAAAVEYDGKAYIFFGESGDDRPYRTFDLSGERWLDLEVPVGTK
ncbi:MAG: hypothetical protein IH945_13715, partial [Armatimonadetes bacterium]|nr:hypothetical protein [Armatimonadota bacterium]